MGFLDAKTSIIHITLTSKGRELLSKGILQPRFFTLFDSEVCYNSSSFDFSIEELPVFEAMSDVSLFERPIYTGDMFDPHHVKITSDVTGSMSIIRSTDEAFETDSVISRYVMAYTMMGAASVSTGSAASAVVVSVVPRVEALRERGNIVDQPRNVSFNRSFTKDKANYLVSVALSSSTGNHLQLFASGSSFGTSDDNNEIVNQSSEYNTANSYYEIVKIT